MTLIQKKPATVIDSSAWIEYFIGSEKGKMARPYVEGGGGITPTIVIAELSALYTVRNWPKWNENLNFIKAKSMISELTLDIADVAGLTRSSMRDIHKDASLADAIICETAKKYEVPVLTCDKHFKGLQPVIFLAK